MKQILILLIRFYQIFISPMLKKNCRHVPSCSQYMIDAIVEWGITKGILMEIRRISRCHPCETSGFDSIPRKPERLSVFDLEESEQLLLQFQKRSGLLPVVVQECSANEILMLAYTNKEACHATIQDKIATFWSTSRLQLWRKGETSGNTLYVDSILINCDQDALIYQVTMQGEGVCHTFGSKKKPRKACFHRMYRETSDLQFIPEMK